MFPTSPVFQPSFSDLGQPLQATTFVVVDLETTGGSPDGDRITEFGAVKIRAGELLGELSTLVNPERSVPTEITMLTGISQHSVEGRPPVSAVLPSFVEFSRGAALVAHNARFDIGFLNAALERLDYPRLDNPVVCTAQLARRLIGDELQNRKLSTLARHFRSTTVPIHRALADARATVDVFHGLLEMAGTFGVVTLEDLIAFSRVRNMPVFSSRRKMADDLPRTPGVYSFMSAAGETLYVGKATDLRARVRQYFGTDTRPRMAALVKESTRVDHIITPTAVEAEILEARMIREHKPRFNKRGKKVRTPVWLTLTADAYPRLSITRKAPDQTRIAMGPLPSRRVAESIMDALHDALPLRRCTERMTAQTRFNPCVLAQIGRCLAPCHGRTSIEVYSDVADQAARVLGGDPDDVLYLLRSQMSTLGDSGRFEDAARVRDRVEVLIRWSTRTMRQARIRHSGLLAASRPAGGAKRLVMVARAGWLLGTADVDIGQVDEAVAHLSARTSPQDCPPPTELAILSRWLDAEHVRIEHSEGGLSWPIASGDHIRSLGDTITAAKRNRTRPAGRLASKTLKRDQC